MTKLKQPKNIGNKANSRRDQKKKKKGPRVVGAIKKHPKEWNWGGSFTFGKLAKETRWPRKTWNEQIEELLMRLGLRGMEPEREIRNEPIRHVYTLLETHQTQ